LQGLEANGLDELVGVPEPTDKFVEQYSAGALQSAVTIKDGRVPVWVFNKPLRIYRCSNVGDLYPLHSKEETPNDDTVGMSYKIVFPSVPKGVAVVLPEDKQCSAVYLDDFKKLLCINGRTAPNQQWLCS